MLSFTTSAFDADVAPSFGTLLATINVALSMLGEVVHPPIISVRSKSNYDHIEIILFLANGEI